MTEGPGARGSWTFRRATNVDQEERGSPGIRITIAAVDMAEAKRTWARFLQAHGESDQGA